MIVGSVHICQTNLLVWEERKRHYKSSCVSEARERLVRQRRSVMRDAMQFVGDAGTVVPLGPSSGRNDLFPFLIFFCRYDLQHDFAWVTDEADH